jgi:hypothetical protein
MYSCLKVVKANEMVWSLCKMGDVKRATWGYEGSSTYDLEEIKKSKFRLMAYVNSSFVKMLIVLFIGGVSLIT